MKKTVTAAIAALVLGAGGLGLASSAWAQAAPAAPAAAPAAADAAANDAAAMPKKATKKIAKKKVKAPKVAVTISNNSGLGLVELDVSISGQGETTKVAGPLAAGKTMKAMIAHDKACLFDIHGAYDDGSISDASGVDLCKDKRINLVP